MVASDTVVGLVGAGILLVALVGVFVYESQQTVGSSEELMNEPRTAKAEGTAIVQRMSGARVPAGAPMAGACAPGATCTDASTTVTLTMKNLSWVNDAFYVAFVQSGQGGGTQTNAGALTASGMDYAISAAKVTVMGSGLRLCLEPKKDSAGCTIELYRWALTAPPGGGMMGVPSTTVPTPVANPLAADVAVNLLPGTPELSISFGASGSATSVNASVMNLTKRAGFQYRGWMVTIDGDNKTFAFVGNVTGEMDGYISGNVPGAKSAYNKFVITLDPAATFNKERPGGPVVAAAKYNMPAAA